MANAQIRVGDAPVSWGVIENVERERGDVRPKKVHGESATTLVRLAYRLLN